MRTLACEQDVGGASEQRNRSACYKMGTSTEPPCSRGKVWAFKTIADSACMCRRARLNLLRFSCIAGIVTMRVKWAERT